MEMESSKPREITVGDLMALIKGFVDTLILASGYQSSGLFVHWDSANLKKAFRWGLFFENVIRHLHSSANNNSFLKELDSSLSELQSNPVFPQGLNSISLGTLYRARTFLMENIVHPLPLRDEYLKALLAVSTELDLDELKGSEYDYLNVYLDKLMGLGASLASLPDRNIKGKVPLLQHSVEDMDIDNGSIDHTKLTAQELLKRKSAVSCLSSAETSLHILSQTFKNDIYCLDKEDPQHATVTLKEVELDDFVTWNQWRSSTILYFIDKRTIELVSGASLIFSAPRTQWIQILKQLSSSLEADDEKLLEILEVMLLGCISSQWDQIIQHLASVTYESLSTMDQYLELCNSLQGRFRKCHLEVETGDSKEITLEDFSNDLQHVSYILTYLAEFPVGSQLKQLWNLPPVLVAAAFPSCSPLLRSYLSEIDSRLKREQSTNRNHNHQTADQERIDRDLAERIWCLYVLHVRGFDVVQKTGSG